MQVSQEIFRIGRKKRLKVPAVFGSFPIDKQIQTLRQKTHIGRWGSWTMCRGSLKLTGVRYLVIDEADLMLDRGSWTRSGRLWGSFLRNSRPFFFSHPG